MFPLSLHRVASANEKRTVSNYSHTVAWSGEKKDEEQVSIFFKCLKNE